MARRRKKSRGWVVLVILVLIAAGAYWFGPWGKTPPGDPNEIDANDAATLNGSGRTGQNGGNGQTPSPHPQGLHFIPYDANTPTPAQARAGMSKGFSMMVEKPIEARELLKNALNYGALGANDAGRVREALENLASRTLFNRSAYVNPRDPYTVGHTFDPGELLVNSGGKRGVISRRELWVPAEGIVMANGLPDAGEFRALETYKMLKGPCHAVVHKDQKAMDIYLRDLFVKRMRIAIGKPETPTPEGTFVVAQKIPGATYYPPVGRGGEISRPGDPEYPLDPRGLFMKLDGIRGTEVSASDGYAIHGTNQPESIGTSASLGCIRLGQKDIQWAWNMLYETKATVTILP